jgi:hypothetical protein
MCRTSKWFQQEVSFRGSRFVVVKLIGCKFNCFFLSLFVILFSRYRRSTWFSLSDLLSRHLYFIHTASLIEMPYTDFSQISIDHSPHFSPSSMLWIMTLIPPCFGSAATLKASIASSSLKRCVTSFFKSTTPP